MRLLNTSSTAASVVSDAASVWGEVLHLVPRTVTRGAVLRNHVYNITLLGLQLPLRPRFTEKNITLKFHE
jgi:hypothetical protein